MSQASNYQIIRKFEDEEYRELGEAMLLQDGFREFLNPSQGFSLVCFRSTAIEPPVKRVRTLSSSLVKYYERAGEKEAAEYQYLLCRKTRLQDLSARRAGKKNRVYSKNTSVLVLRSQLMKINFFDPKTADQIVIPVAKSKQ